MSTILEYYFGLKCIVREAILAYITIMVQDLINLEELGWISSEENQERFLLLGLKLEVTTTIGKVEQVTRLKNFLMALAMFIQHKCTKLDKKITSNIELDYLVDRLDWVKSYLVQLHLLLKCQRRTGKEYQDTKLLESKYLRYTPQWRGEESQKDYCQVQEFLPTDLSNENPLPNPLNGQQIGQLQALVTVVDIRCRLRGSKEHPTYCYIFVDTMLIKNQGQPYKIYSMIEVGPILISYHCSNQEFIGC